MKFIMAFVVLGLCLVGFGFYRGWFTLSSHGRDADSNKVDVNLTVDPDKVKEDVEKVRDKTTELGQKAKDKMQSNAEQEDAIQRIDTTHTMTSIRV